MGTLASGYWHRALQGDVLRAVQLFESEPTGRGAVS
jgi:hypothetical protein